MRQLIAVTTLLTLLHLVAGQEFQCTLEKVDSSENEHCVFRDVNLRSATTGAKFSYPAGAPKPTHVAFESSNMKQLPSNFLNLAGPELKVLRVEGCNLQSVTISSGLEALYAKGNQIGSLIVHQSGLDGPLRTLDLSGNILKDISNVTKCQSIETLNLSDNDLGDTLELNKFKGMNNLRMLNLANNYIDYIDNTGRINLESLEDLDLSNNNILPSDLNIEIFYPFTHLHTLRLNDNLMAELDYNMLLNIKSLKTIYLNGNNFDCSYLQEMLQHIQRNNVQTPTGGPYSCKNNLDGFCCTGSVPMPPTKATAKPTPGPEPETTTKRADIPAATVKPDTAKDGGSFSWLWLGVGIGVLVLVGAAIVGFVVWKKKQKGNNYRVPAGNLELS